MIAEHLYNPFLQTEEKDLVPEPVLIEVQPSEPRPAASPSPEETDETWEEKEDKLDTENVEPESAKSVEQKYQYKEGEGETAPSVGLPSECLYRFELRWLSCDICRCLRSCIRA